MYSRGGEKQREQYYGLCYAREQEIKTKLCKDVSTKKIILSHYQQIFKDAPITLPGQNQRVAHLLTQVFQELGYNNKSIGTLIADVKDGKDIYRVWGITTHPSKEYTHLNDLKEAITLGNVVVTGYIKKDKQYCDLIRKINELQSKQAKLNGKYGLQIIRTTDSNKITCKILYLAPSKYKAVDYNDCGHDLTFTMDPKIIPFIDIHQKNSEINPAYSEQMLITLSFLMFGEGDRIADEFRIKRLTTQRFENHSKPLVEEAFEEYLNSPTTDDVDPNF